MVIERAYVMAVSIKGRPAKMLSDVDFAALLLDEHEDAYSIANPAEVRRGTTTGYASILEMLYAGTLRERDGSMINSRNRLLKAVQDHWGDHNLETAAYDGSINNVFFLIPTVVLTDELLHKSGITGLPCGDRSVPAPALSTSGGGSRLPWLL